MRVRYTRKQIQVLRNGWLEHNEIACLAVVLRGSVEVDWALGGLKISSASRDEHLPSTVRR